MSHNSQPCNSQPYDNQPCNSPPCSSPPCDRIMAEEITDPRTAGTMQQEVFV